MYSFLDIETTGNHAMRHHMTEIAILNYDGVAITDRFITLLRPASEVPFFISQLTGITREMVYDAPLFEEVADKIDELTYGRILVAHNAHFDYTFLKQAFSALGKTYQRKILCTLRLSRKILPGLPSYALNKLCRSLSISQCRAHRAESDAQAALEVFGHLKKVDQEDLIMRSLVKKDAEYNYPPNLSYETLRILPESSGIYYFIDQQGKVLYIGKAKSIKHRVNSHFVVSSSTRMRTPLMNSIHNIRYTVCGNELVSMLLESAEIKKHFPPFNIAQKFTDLNYGIYGYEDGNGYQRFGIRKLKYQDRPLLSFPALPHARAFLSNKIKEFKLCAKLSGLQRMQGACLDHPDGICDGACCSKISPMDYNMRMNNALKSFKSENRSFAVICSGRTEAECSIVMIEDGKYLGFGFAEKAKAPADFSSAKELIDHYNDNREVQRIIYSFLNKNNAYSLLAAKSTDISDSVLKEEPSLFT
ncbi:MAG: GIY-YIG nuclease family protein [Chitinophagales bacterium]|nr:GIY-YIG nuclease family protein [Chitinophagales bacterium]